MKIYNATEHIGVNVTELMSFIWSYRVNKSNLLIDSDMCMLIMDPV